MNECRPTMRDLLVLVADKDAEQGLTSLLKRHQDLRIRPITYRVDRHPRHDAGVFKEAAAYLRLFHKQFQYALAILDFEGCGRETEQPDSVCDDLQKRLNRAGLANRSRVIVIEPELEVWAWAGSRTLDVGIGWAGRQPSLHDWLQSNEFWPQGVSKPGPPKKALGVALRHVQRQTSSSLFRKLGATIDFSRCTDPAFQLLLATLREWFPPA